MLLPYLTELQNPSKKYTVSFRGINYGEGYQDGELAECKNLSTEKYPCISQRAKRVKVGQYEAPQTLHTKDGIIVIDKTNVFYNETKIGEVTEGRKQTATIGNYVVIFPDKVYYNVDTKEFRNMEEEITVAGIAFTHNTISIGSFRFSDGATVVVSGCTTEENNKTVVVKSSSESELTFEDNTFAECTEFDAVTITRNQEIYSKIDSVHEFTENSITTHGTFNFQSGDTVIISGCKTNESNNKTAVIKQAGEKTLTFEDKTFAACVERGNITITRKEEKVSASGLVFSKNAIKMTALFNFGDGDAVKITGCATKENNKTPIISAISDDKKTLTFKDNTFTEATELVKVTLKREVPDLEFICESNYRLWGTKGNTIFSSAFSDPLNFFVFDNLANDSYNIDVGSDGAFTGCIPYSSHICFFKENTLHKLHGTKPSNFQVVTANIYGVQSGCERSMCIVNEQLLYKGVDGVYSYTGGVPELISSKFGAKRYSDAVATCDGERYYISMKHNDEWGLYVYDVLKNIWLREDDTHAYDMTFYDGHVYFIDESGALYKVDRTAGREDIEWSATFCPFNETVNEKKGYSKFHLRIDMAKGAWLMVDVKADTDTQWREVYKTHNDKARTISVPIIPTRCDSVTVRLRGKGECTVKAFIREFITGSDK